MLKTYNHNIAQAQAAVNKYQKLINAYSLLRLAIFALVALSIYISLSVGGTMLLIALCVVLFFAFIWLVSRQSGFEERRQYFKALKQVNENEVESIINQQNIYNNGQRFGNDGHSYTSDLDIFGPASLYQLINRAATYPGMQKLASWLTAPSNRNEVIERQAAVQELAAKGHWKLDMQARLLHFKDEHEDKLKSLFAYLHTSVNLPGEKVLRTYIKLAPWLLIAAIALSIVTNIGAAAATFIVFFHIAINLYYGRYMIKSGFIADKIGQLLQQYASLFKSIEEEEWQSAGCGQLARQLTGNSTSKKIAELGKLINKLSYSLIMLVGFVLNVFLLWSLRQILAIEDWKRSNNENMGYAFNILGHFEALYSLAGLHINYPAWAFPQIDDAEGYTYKADALAHPLINNPGRVSNNFNLDNTFKIDIITGSNMAGKSTFLRTLGINAVLALGGAPVCANTMTVSVIHLFAYMRIKDSLNESTSTFKAELDRLQMLLQAVEHGNKIYFLVDEMLRGTNSVDKYLGSKAVIEQLIRKQGVGLVATHDLQIARLEDEYPDYIRNFYFDIQVIDGEMLFDYKIKPGACKTFNASILLKRIGITVKES